MDRILFISNVPSPYNVEYLNELGKLADVTAVFERSFSQERDNSWKAINAITFRYIALKGIHVKADSAFSPGVINYIRKFNNEKIIIGNPATPTGILAITYCKAARIPYILQSEGGIPKDGKGPKEHFKKWLMKSAKLYLSGMNPEHDYFLTYGATKDRIVQYPFTSLYEKDIIKTIPSDDEKKALRKELGIDADFMIIYVGQIIHRKGIDILLKAVKDLPDHPYVLLVGGQPTAECLTLMREKGLDNVHFMGFTARDELARYYLASDLFVFPTREDTWGLVVNEAMAAGLPVITTKNCVAGVELIEDGINGRLVDVEDVEGLHRAMVELMQDAEKRTWMSRNSLNTIRNYTYENMAKAIYRGLVGEEQ